MSDSAPDTGMEFRDDQRRRTGLDGATIKQLSEINGFKATVSILETFGVIALSIFLALQWWSVWAVIPALIVIASRQQACFVLAHDAAHYRLYRPRWANDLAGRLIGGVVGISMCTYRVVHRLHHNHLYEKRDPDVPLHGGYPRGRAYLLRKLTGDLCGLTAHKTYAYFFGAPAINDNAEAANRPLDDTSPLLRRAARRDRWLVVAGQLILLATAVASGYALEYAILWLLPAVTVLQAFLRFRAILEHGAVTDYGSPLTAARTNLGPAWLRWSLFPHQVNYHIEHHLYPAVPHYNLPACHAALKKAGMLEGAEVRQIPATARMVLADPA